MHCPGGRASPDLMNCISARIQLVFGMYSVSVKILEQESGPARVALKLVCSGKLGRAFMVWQPSVWSIS